MHFKSLQITFLILLFSVQAILAQSKIERVTPFPPVNDTFNLYGEYKNFIVFKNKIYFTVNEGTKGREPFMMDSSATSIKMLKDIDPRQYIGSIETDPRWTVSGDNLFFIAKDSINGTELWKTDGTEIGTKLVKNISAKDTSTFFRDIISLGNGKILFGIGFSNRTSYITQFWTSDGTEAGTQPFFEVPDLFVYITVLNNQIFFSANNSELYQTDGTTVGTKLIINLKDIEPQIGRIRNLRSAGNKLFIASSHSVLNQWDLWTSDGTRTGTTILLKSSPDKSFLSFFRFTALGDKVFFTTSRRGPNYELYITDGTSQGTKVVKNFNNSPGSDFLTVLNDKLLFTATDAGTGYQGLWVSDGTEEGTKSLRSDLNITSYEFPGESFYTFGRKAYFATGFAYYGGSNTFYNHINFWETDGTTNGTRETYSFPDKSSLIYKNSNGVVYNGKYYVGLTTNSTWHHIFAISDTIKLQYTSTFIRKSCTDSTGDLSIKMLNGVKPFQFKLDNLAEQSDSVFKNIKGGIYLLTISDGAGTRIIDTLKIPILKDSILTSVSVVGTDCVADSLKIAVTGGYPPYQYQIVNFAQNTEGVFKNVPIGKQSIMVTDSKGCQTNLDYTITLPKALSMTTSFVNNCAYDSAFVQLFPVNGRAPYQYSIDNQPFIIDTVLKTTADFHRISVKDSRGCIFNTDSFLYKRTPLSIVYEVTRSLHDKRNDIKISSAGGRLPHILSFNTENFIATKEFLQIPLGEHTLKVKDSLGCEIIKNINIKPFPRLSIDLVKDINTNFPYASSTPRDMTVCDNKLFFSANIDNNGFDLYESNGTTEGTKLLTKDAYYQTYDQPFKAVIGKKLFMMHDDLQRQYGKKIWVYENDSLYVLRGESPYLGYQVATSGSFMVLGDKMLFNGRHAKGNELWISDGTSEGTQLLKDINPIGDGYPESFVKMNNNKVLFTAYDGNTGYEPWITDGTNGNTLLLKGIAQGSSSSSIRFQTNFKDKHFFTAYPQSTFLPEIWETNGTANGTKRFFLPNNINLTDIESLWQTDSMLFIEINRAGDNTLLISDGTEANTRLFFDSLNVTTPFIKVNNKYVFGADYRLPNTNTYPLKGLWVTDLTRQGTYLIKSRLEATDFFFYENNAYFVGNDGTNGRELWLTDGSSEGTIRVTNIRVTNIPNYGLDSNIIIRNPTLFNNQIFMGATNINAGVEFVRLIDSVALQADFTRNNTNGNCQNIGSIDVSAKGGTPPYLYQLDSLPFQTSSTLKATKTKHLVSVIDSKGARFSRYFNFIVDSIIISAKEVCGRNVSLTAIVQGGFAPYTYAWSNNNTTPTAINLNAGLHTVTVTDVCNTKSIKTFEISSCVWPGDTDSSGQVNHFDLLPIGLYANQSGVGRSKDEQNWLWYGHPARNWAVHNLVNMPNAKHFDTDGDGFVRPNRDTSAILSNWSKERPQFVPVITKLQNTATPVLYISLPTTNLVAGRTYTAPIILGETNNEATDVYGLGFSIKYDSRIIDPQSVTVTANSSWFGNAGLFGFIQRNFPEDSRLDLAITQQFRYGINGKGQIAQLIFTIRPNANVNLLNITPENALLIDNSAKQLPIELRQTSVGITTSTQDYGWSNTIQVYPTLVDNTLNIDSKDLLIQKLTITDALGRIIHIKKPLENTVSIPLSILPQGLYFVHLETEKGIIARKFYKL